MHDYYLSSACTLGLLMLLATCTVADETRVGVASVDITPPLGIPMAGYYHERGAEGILDPLFCKALVIERDGQRVALVTLDIISVTGPLSAAARSGIEQATGIPGERVMISATHAHTGPQLANRGLRSQELGGAGQLALDYTESLPDKIVACVKLAADQVENVRLLVATGQCEDLAYNRRYFMRDGSVGWNPGKLNPHIVLPAGPTDPQVHIVYAEKPHATGPTESVATYVNFAMHPDTTGGNQFSADWPGALSRVLAGYHGPHHCTLVGNGTCGNLNNYDFFWKWPNNGPGEQNRIGAILGAAVFQAYKSLRPVGDGPLQVRSEQVELDLPVISPADLEDARKTVAEVADDQGANFMKLVRAYRALDVARREGKPHQVEVQVIAVGKDVAWVSLPGEVFVELGLAIKKRSPFPVTCVVELANDSIGYIPDRRSYAEGNYEPESARCAAGSGERLVDVASRLLEELYAP
ncbi:MAG: neutral/alkaline non-lysosomal ceramidase N-terminal domain-containing protein [Pirellulaceae bacterium]